MAAGPQDAPRHAGQVVRRVLLRRNIAIDAETAQLVAVAVQAALQSARALPATTPTPARRRRRQRAVVLTPNPGDADPEGSRYIPYRPDNGAWLNAAEDQPWLRLRRPAALGWTLR